jgi:hypothetical protein
MADATVRLIPSRLVSETESYNDGAPPKDVLKHRLSGFQSLCKYVISYFSSLNNQVTIEIFVEKPTGS